MDNSGILAIGCTCLVVILHEDSVLMIEVVKFCLWLRSGAECDGVVGGCDRNHLWRGGRADFADCFSDCDGEQ